MPCKENLKKVLAVRRSKVFAALSYLSRTHPLYFNIPISFDAVLPNDDIPDEIWNMVTVYEDKFEEDPNEHANYTPQSDILLADNSNEILIMESSGVLDLDGNRVSTDDQVK